MDPLVPRVVRRFLSFKHKETKANKVDRLSKQIREATGLSRGQSEDIADAIVRGREVERLALQKSWPIQGGVIEGPKGTLDLKELDASE